ncbi:MAG: hypothetical protein A2741_00860 [Candidatus Zambryskibacteria bacterium RIFCSPHIGHO2_01_FULL_43_27]|uniref:Uncharacterized protein n=1 Tax=Candidatus Zambryskibacteria bacterium RIFCSPLOWO2_01_FULL_43_17 TaxID=1802760 RepID=A0A1G2U508_9BACT|nr:MAG: hypothetical protein A2741_00860 [Candidatus Zambryskibacteria bacterium RIFCSPHIGHO2_01_FULL_43_27]OHB00464.1 MAG: hypothetical protein A3E93_01520 [Candidatus Zambryskibacteria bacterium RIFCSPHIGHO2_12_FULL_43_12b]OHB04586.1 MAG: hypothetical protein A2920_01440 [Candidatus Zambryskibacteria bacterium RIFCSPLOWO2_01_FULL_43_17]
MSRPALWFTFGSLPKSGHIVVLSVDHTSKPSDKVISERKVEAFGEKAHDAVCETICLYKGRQRRFKAEFKKFLRHVGVPEYKLQEVLLKFANETERILNSR